MAQPFTLYVMQSAHTDIGYTHPQEQIMWMYLDYYDRVLELCARDEIAPVENRFKWTCETSWQVRNYLEARPERLGEFIHFVRSGQIEITASFLHFTDMIDREAYQYSLKWAVDFCHKYDLPLRCAMHCDINGWPWAIPDLLAEQNIPYFCSQVHIDSATDPLGKRGSVHYHWILEWGEGLRADTPIRIPQAFWWQGPDGKKVLHWLNEHYHLGNFLGLSGNKSFASEKGRYFWETDQTPVDDLYAVAEREVPRYIERIKREGYPHDSLLMSISGFWVDNSAPDDRWCEIIARWNAEHADIKLRTATLSEWFAEVETFDTANLPTYQVAWPDGWAHGLGTMSSRIAQARKLQRNRANVIGLVEQSGSKQAQGMIDSARELELYAVEHTFNAWMTTAVPNAAPISFLQAAKELDFQRAELHYQEAATQALRKLVPSGGDHPSLYVSFDEAGSPLRIVEFAATDRDLDPEKQVLVAEDGQSYRFQRESGATEMPRFTALLPVVKPGLAAFQLADRQPSEPDTSPISELQNDFWNIRIDPTTGALTKLYDKGKAREWLGDQEPYGFGQLVHENVTHPLGRNAVGNMARVIALGIAGEPLLKHWIDAPISEHSSPTIDLSCGLERGGVFDAVQLEGELGAMGRVIIHWRLYHRLPLIELVLDWDKQWNDKPEAAYVAFPFAHQGGTLKLESGGGFFQPGSHKAGGQLPGTVSSYYTMQRAAHIQAGDGASLLWLPLDAPLVMTQEINYNRWETDPYDWNGFLASMPVNHYWHTNFASSQRGGLRLRYRIYSPGSNLEAAVRTALPIEAFGWR